MTTDSIAVDVSPTAKRPISVGVYDATDAFRAIDQHSCVCFADDMTLIATTGRADDPTAQAWSDLIAAAPDLLAALKETHAALDVALATIITLDHDFRPTQWARWPAVVNAHDVIKRAEAR